MDKAAWLFARAFEIFEKISPLKKTDPERIAVYGLIPIQQPADIYDGWGHGGRGGWSWYTGSAARMLSAAYAMLGIVQTDGEIARAGRPVRGQGRDPGGGAQGRRKVMEARRRPSLMGVNRSLPSFGRVRRLALSTFIARTRSKTPLCALR